MKLLTGCALSVVLLCAYTVRAPLITYVSINDATARCQFNFPSNYQQRSETEGTMYSAEGDDDITYEMHHRTTTTVESVPGQNFQNQVNNTSTSARLQQFANTMAQATGGQIVNQSAFTQDGQEGREIELNFTEEGDSWKLYARFFWHNNTIYAFTIATIYNTSTAATAAEAAALAAARSQYFGSIDFY